MTVLKLHPCTICGCSDFEEDPEHPYGVETDQLVCVCDHVEDEHE